MSTEQKKQKASVSIPPLPLGPLGEGRGEGFSNARGEGARSAPYLPVDMTRSSVMMRPAIVYVTVFKLLSGRLPDRHDVNLESEGHTG